MEKTAVKLMMFLLMTICYLVVHAQSTSIVRGDSSDFFKFADPKTGNDSIPKVEQLLNYANSFMGKRYRRGGTSQKGFDCSGFTMTVFAHIGIRLPHTSAGQGLMGLEVSKNNIRKGDLIFFKGRSRRGSRIGHVGIVVSEKGEPVRFIHSSVSEGVMIDNLSADYYRNRFVRCTRVLLF
ncbi:MAG: C40 family peptidase [Bacteroidia bacterium]